MTDEPWDDDEDWHDHEDDESAIVRCPECGREIFAEADACPECGYWLSEADRRRLAPGRRLRLGIQVVAVVVLLAFVLLTVLAVF